MQKFTTHTAAETESLAQQLLPEIMNKRIVLLSGQLGSGKTTFVKGLAKALGIEKAIKSPTYTYLNKYQISNSKIQDPNSPPSTINHQLSTLHHFDLYRLPEQSSDSHHPSASLGLEDALNDPQALVIIEWPERIPMSIPALHISFEKHTDHHTITVAQLISP